MITEQKNIKKQLHSAKGVTIIDVINVDSIAQKQLQSYVSS